MTQTPAEQFPAPDARADAGQRPEPTTRGTFALYPTQDGGLHLVYRLQGEEDDGHQDIPAWAVTMLRKVAAGENPGVPGVAMRAFQKMARRAGAPGA